MGLSTRYTWGEFYPGIMDIRKPVRHYTRHVYVPHYLYAPSLYSQLYYSHRSPYTDGEFTRRTDEALARSHYYLDGQDLNYLHLIDRPHYALHYSLPHRKSFYARLMDRALLY